MTINKKLIPLALLFCATYSFASLKQDDFLRFGFAFSSIRDLDNTDQLNPEIRTANEKTIQIYKQHKAYENSHDSDYPHSHAPPVTLEQVKEVTALWIGLEKAFPNDPLKQAFFRRQALKTWSTHFNFFVDFKNASLGIKQEARKEILYLRNANADFALSQGNDIYWLLRAFDELEINVQSSMSQHDVEEYYSAEDLKKAANILENLGDQLSFLPQPDKDSEIMHGWLRARSYSNSDEEMPKLSLSGSVLAHAAELWSRIALLKRSQSAYTHQIQAAARAYVAFQKAALDAEQNPKSAAHVPRLRLAAALVSEKCACGLRLLNLDFPEYFKDKNYERYLQDAERNSAKNAKEAAFLFLRLANQGDKSAFLKSAWAYKQAGFFSHKKEKRIAYFILALEMTKKAIQEDPNHTMMQKFNNNHQPSSYRPNLQEELEIMIKACNE